MEMVRVLREVLFLQSRRPLNEGGYGISLREASNMRQAKSHMLNLQESKPQVTRYT